MLSETFEHEIYLDKEDELLEKFTEERNRKYPALSLTFRKLQVSDYDNGYFETLSNLTEVGNPSKEEFASRFRTLDSSIYKLIVAVDNETGKIIASGNLLIEHKFIRKLGTWGHVEDIAVWKEYSGKYIGMHLIYILKEIAKINLCYKVILDCTEELAKFYAKNDFKVKGIQMSWYNDDVIEHHSTNYDAPSVFGILS